jgi:ribosomal protein S16
MILLKRLSFNKLELHKYLNSGAYPTDTVRHLIYKMMAETEKIIELKTI